MNDKQRSEDQKWNEWLGENCRIQVEYPDMAEMEQQKNRILQSALPEKDSLFERLKKIYYGPGLGIIFYRCTLIWVVMILLYIGVLVLSIGIRDARQTQMAVVLFAFPAMYLGFSFLSCWVDEQEAVTELINSMHYSMHYIVGLRMFYASFVSALINLGTLLVLGGQADTIFWKLSALGVSSMCLFAVFALYLYHCFSSSYGIGVLLVLWGILAVFSAWSRYAWIKILLTELPLAIHFAVAAGFFICFVVLTGKVEKENVTVVAYQ